MATINDTTREILVRGTNGEPLLWLETYADGLTAIIDTMRWATPFDPNGEHIGHAVEDWMRAIGMRPYQFVVYWDGVNEDDADRWCNATDYRIWSGGISGGIEPLDVWGTDYDDAREYLESVIVEGMSIGDGDEIEDE